MKKVYILSVLALSSVAMAALSPAGKASDEASITEVLPTRGAIGSTVTIKGTNFGTDCEYENGGYGGDCQMSVIFDGGKEVRFSDSDDNDRDWSETSITVLVPQGAQSGKLKVHYFFNNFNEDTNDDVSFDLTGPEFTVLSENEAPVITSVTPLHAKAGDVITIRGRNFGDECPYSPILDCTVYVQVGSAIIDFEGAHTGALVWKPDEITFVAYSGGLVSIFYDEIERANQPKKEVHHSISAFGPTLTLYSSRLLADRAQEVVDIDREALAFSPDPLSGKPVTTSFETITTTLNLDLQRNLAKEAEAEKLLDRIYEDFDSSKHLGGHAHEYSFIFYVAYDTGTTAALGAGERAGVLNSWRSAYDADFPTSSWSWEHVLKIANGRWPENQNLTAESEAGVRFQQIYKRSANRSNPHDDAAVMTLAYGLRPEPRNLQSEWQASQIFKSIYGALPTTAIDWDAVRAIAYSGATR